MRKILATIAVAVLLLCMATVAFAQTGTPAATPGGTVVPTATAAPTVSAAPNASAVPGMANLVQTASGMGNLKTFSSLVNKAGLSDTLSKGGPYTVLAPSDDAFNRMPPGALNALSNDTPRLKSVLSNHVIQGRYTANQLLDTKKVTTLDNKTLVITPRQGYVKIGSGFITKEDQPASNGIIQVMDTVIIPK